MKHKIIKQIEERLKAKEDVNNKYHDKHGIIEYEEGEYKKVIIKYKEERKYAVYLIKDNQVYNINIPEDKYDIEKRDEWIENIKKNETFKEKFRNIDPNLEHHKSKKKKMNEIDKNGEKKSYEVDFDIGIYDAMAKLNDEGYPTLFSCHGDNNGVAYFVAEKIPKELERELKKANFIFKNFDNGEKKGISVYSSENAERKDIANEKFNLLLQDWADNKLQNLTKEEKKRYEVIKEDKDFIYEKPKEQQKKFKIRESTIQRVKYYDKNGKTVTIAMFIPEFLTGEGIYYPFRGILEEDLKNLKEDKEGYIYPGEEVKSYIWERPSSHKEFGGIYVILEDHYIKVEKEMIMTREGGRTREKDHSETIRSLERYKDVVPTKNPKRKIGQIKIRKGSKEKEEQILNYELNNENLIISLQSGKELFKINTSNQKDVKKMKMSEGSFKKYEVKDTIQNLIEEELKNKHRAEIVSIHTIPESQRYDMKTTTDIVMYRKTKDGIKILLGEREFPPLGLALPGGQIEEGETAIENAVKEIEEETGVKVMEKDMKEVGNYNMEEIRGQLNTTLYTVEVKETDTYNPTSDLKSVKEYDLEEVLRLIRQNKIVGHHQQLIKNAIIKTPLLQKEKNKKEIWDENGI